MTSTTLVASLAPLERLHLRETLQDLWRLQVRRITLLSLASYDESDGTDQSTLVEARETLQQLEAAMRQLDEGSYGRCTICSRPIGYAALMGDPLSIVCTRCGG